MALDAYSDIRERHLGPIAVYEPEMAVQVDAGALVRRLLLFDHVVLESARLKEIPALVALFGAQGLLDLLDSGVLEIVCDALTIGEIGRVAGLEITDHRGGPLPIGAYRLSAISAADREQYLHGVLQEVHSSQIRFREVKRLKKELAGRLLRYPRIAAEAAVEATHTELTTNPAVIGEAIRLATVKKTRRDPGALALDIEPLALEGDFRITAPIAQRIGVDAGAEDQIVRLGLLAAAGLNQRILLMEHFAAVTGFQDAELPVFANKLSFLAGAMDPSAQEQRFDRVLSIGGLPDLRHPAPGIDAGRLLELRGRAEWREFRRWLRTVDSETDDQIADRFASLRAQAAELMQSPGGRVVRFVVNGAIGLTGFLPGAAASAVDGFLVDRILGRPGPTAFLGRWYPTIFRDG